ncbi:Nif3-like dinuclear metal center hexameric protein [Mobiluncus mulieris]|uniref:GTP cyclohydrolase 1 type 2 homolog n=1 Tax=Mobiluncus mulieris TaxID=2052 RepID=A0ABD4TXW5_9ACTO|nr:Nif3-like dinuclear metal center hexameric protein [Mobiluncus mulieris]MCU9968986.1 Nif3-like dinuclear metal center hexameric protein [Mobiluncus mulieris]MCU9973675.1 Nif3-like dinuclear metal center hexameric protein [Mobiluncus mulieris]MCV0009331.1 Nif3-like dinuclear metal center hexameric protein [Mobiluncus mulieris]NMW75116.1 Nif3-like dinuclear metal center hexameric protein [Mobiluncus mulieris]NMX01063.1 Nif3-like dinuclear metal center hexameric protein [Mobiluncus mulieris]
MNRKTLTLGEVADWMDEQYPPELREDWDRVGLICGDRQDPVTKILLAVDPTEAVVDEALEWGAQLVITHHPLFLRGTSFVSTDTARGRVVHRLIRAHAGLFNAHTNADAAAGGVAEALAEAAGLTAATWRPLEPNPNHPELGIGRVGDLPEPCILGDLANRLAEVLPDSPAGLLVAGDLDREVKTVAVSGGSGQSLLEAARESGAEVFVTADLRHHPALDYREESGAPALLVPSHWASEWLWLPRLATALELWAGEHNFAVETRISKIVSEPWDAYIPTLTSDSLNL